VRIARDELRRIRELTRSIDELQRQLAVLVAQLAPRLLAERGCGVRRAAKLIGEIAGIERFATDAKLARTCGSAPIPASSGRTERRRLHRGATASSNCALHRLAVSKGRASPRIAAYLARNTHSVDPAERVAPERYETAPMHDPSGVAATPWSCSASCASRTSC
jgi:transposase